MPRISATPDRASSWRERPRPCRGLPRGRALARVRAVVFGRPLASEAEIDERLSKTRRSRSSARTRSRSSAYATEEILRVLVLAGAGAMLALDPGRDRDRGPADGRRPSRTARSAAPIPNGGGAYVVARTNLAPDLRADRRRGAAHRLRHDGRGVDRVGDRPDPVGHPGGVRLPDRDRLRVDLADHIANLRGLRESRQHLRGPHLPVRRSWRWRSSPSAAFGSSPGRRPPVPPQPTRCRSGPRRSRSSCCSRPLPAVGRADRRRGDRQRRAGVQAARGRRTPPTR